MQLWTCGKHIDDNNSQINLIEGNDLHVYSDVNHGIFNFITITSKQRSKNILENKNGFCCCLHFCLFIYNKNHDSLVFVNDDEHENIFFY